MERHKLYSIADWIEGAVADFVQPGQTAVHETFGFVEMDNGKKAQIQITLEMDEDDWQ